MALSDVTVKNLKPTDKMFKVYDERGLYLEITPQGSKRWRFKYRFLKKEKLLSLGVYPDVKLKEARERRDEMRRLLAQDIDPSLHRKSTKEASLISAANSFELVAMEWHSKYSSSWVESHSSRILTRLKRDIFPWIGSKSIAKLSPQEILKCIQRIESRGALETAHRAMQNCSHILRYAVATGRAERDVTVDLRGALPPVKEKHFPAITDPDKVGELLRAIDGFEGTFIVQCALKLAPLVFVRPGELRKARWSDIDFENREWRYLVTKTKTEHIVPLSNQSLAILKEMYPLTGNSENIFPSARGKSRPMSDNAILAALRRLEIPKEEMTGHGFRAMARTILDEVLGFPGHLIDHQLAHSVKDPNGRAYNRTANLPQRKVMMQSWADYLDKLKSNSIIVPFRRGV